jgi:hypothetical protein
MVVDELRRATVARAEELLRIGIRLTEQTHVVAQEDGQPLQPNSLTHEFVRLSEGERSPAHSVSRLEAHSRNTASV